MYLASLHDSEPVQRCHVAAIRRVVEEQRVIQFAANANNTSNGNYVHLHNCLLADNVGGDHLINGDGNGAGSQIIVDTCTLTNNDLGSSGMAVIGADVNFVEITNSIVYQPPRSAAIPGSVR